MFMLVDVFQWLHDLPVSATVRESFYVFPALECTHIYSMIFLITVIAAFDLRLMGIRIGRHSQSLSSLSKLVLRWAWVCFTVNFVTGAFLFASKAPEYYLNSAFRIKMLLILLGVVYHSVLVPKASKWEEAPASMGTRLAGGFSLILWVGVIAASRWIAFV
jgi:uncharacterized protein DUF6644